MDTETRYIIAEAGDGGLLGPWDLYEVKRIGTIKCQDGGHVIVDDAKENRPFMNLMDAAKEILKQKGIRGLPQPRIRVSTFKWRSRNDP